MDRKTKEIEKFDESGKFYGYANVFNVEDSQGDIVLNGAFSKTLRDARNIKLLFQHNPKDVMGQITLLREDVLGLYVEGRIHLEDQLGKNIYRYIQNDLLNGLSIGYSVNDSSIDGRGRRLIKSLTLLEISLVSSPANRFSKIIYCKSGSG
ncbi:MAG: HK97 family phage prohead protease [Rickettsiales bacterium]|jgi:HK97 family phage prohead protease|nr:HK97 family phage prohead protease [Rickettsiales bacterium]